MILKLRESVEWIQVAQGTAHYKTVVRNVTNLRYFRINKNILTIWGTISFKKNILFSTKSSNTIATRNSRSSSSSNDVKRYNKLQNLNPVLNKLWHQELLSV